MSLFTLKCQIAGQAHEAKAAHRGRAVALDIDGEVVMTRNLEHATKAMAARLGPALERADRNGLPWVSTSRSPKIWLSTASGRFSQALHNGARNGRPLEVDYGPCGKTVTAPSLPCSDAIRIIETFGHGSMPKAP